jgi:hypothetical protein
MYVKVMNLLQILNHSLRMVAKHRDRTSKDLFRKPLVCMVARAQARTKTGGRCEYKDRDDGAAGSPALVAGRGGKASDILLVPTQRHGRERATVAERFYLGIDVGVFQRSYEDRGAHGRIMRSI